MAEIKSLNEQIDLFRKKVREHQQKVINNEIQVSNVKDLQVFFEGLIILTNVYYNIDKQLTKKQRQVVKEKLERELSYIKISNQLRSGLTEYHKTKLFDEKEWEDFCTIIRYQNLEYSLGQKVDIATWNQYESIALKVLAAESRMMKRIHLSVSNFDINRGEKGKRENYELNLNTFLKMDLFGQIEYLEKLIENIEKRKDTKAEIVVGGLSKEISCEYAYNYQYYTALLDNLYLKREEEFEKIKKEQKIDEEPLPDIKVEDAEEYVYFSEEKDKIENQLMRLVANAFEAPKEETVEVKLFTSNMEENIKISRKDISSYEILFEKYKMLLQSGKEQIEKLRQYGIDPFKKSDKEIENVKNDILKKIAFLQQNKNGNLAIDACIQEKVIEYCKLSKQENFRFMASFIHFFKKQGFSNEDAKALAKLAYDPEVFAKNKNIPNEKKEKVLSKLFSTIAQKETIKKEEPIEEIQENEDFQIDWKAVNRMSFKEEYEYFGTLAAKISKYSEKYPNNQIHVEFEGHMYPVNEKNKAQFEKCREEAKRVWNEWRGGLKKEHPEVNNPEGIIKKALKKIKKQEERMPESDKKYISKIKKIRKPKNKKVLQGKLKKTILQIVVVLSFTACLFVGALSQRNTQETSIKTGKRLEELAKEDDDSLKLADELGDLLAKNFMAQKVSNEQNVIVGQLEVDQVQELIDNGYSVDEDAKIYENYYDAYNDVNAKTAYFSNESYRDVTEVVYKCDGSLVHLRVDDPDFEAQRTALENNGYELDSVRGRNENGTGNGYEGYFNIEDVDVFNTQIGGR